MQPKKTLPEIQALAKQVRREIIEMIGAAKSGHPGGSLSAVEIVVTLYFDFMRIDPHNPKWPDRDRFVLSKGHAAPVLYAVMAEAGYTPNDQLNTLRKLGSIYQGHPDMRFIPSLEASTGSLGEGLSLIWHGSAARLDGSPSRFYVLLGDGEIQEGQVWEGAMVGAFHKLDNIVAIVDYNGIQLDGFVKDIMDVAPLADKWRAFGWHTIEIDGHDIPAIHAAFREAEATKGKPTAIVAHTMKGKGVSFMENNPKFHGTAPTAGGSQAGLTGAAITADQDQIRAEAGPGHARSLRQGAGGAGPRKQGHRGLRRGPFEIHHHGRISRKNFPTASFRCGIAEANMVAIGAGLAYWRARFPFVSSFSAFVINKGFEQLRVTVAYPKRQPEGGRDAQRHFDRRGRPVADEHRGDRPGLFAARLCGALARR